MTSQGDFANELEGDLDARNSGLVRLFVRLAYEQADASPSVQLSEVYKQLATSRSTLAAATRKAYGIGPKELMRRVRLEQCRNAFIRPGPTTKIETTMRRYGFTNRKAFADHYRNVYRELPSATLQRGFGQLRLKGI